MILKRMSDFVLEQIEFRDKAQGGDVPSDSELLEKIEEYTRYIKRPLKQGMFVGENKILKGFYVTSHISLTGLEVKEIAIDFRHKKLVVFRHVEGFNTTCHYEDLEELIETGVEIETVEPLF